MADIIPITAPTGEESCRNWHIKTVETQDIVLQLPALIVSQKLDQVLYINMTTVSVYAALC